VYELYRMLGRERQADLEREAERHRLAREAQAGRQGLRPRPISVLPIVCAYAVLLSIWSSTWIAIKVGLHGAPPLIGAGIRFAVAGAILAAFQLVTRRPLRLEREHRRLVGITAVSVFLLPYGFVYAGETQVTAGLAAVLWGSLPLFSAVFASRLLSDEPLTRLKLLGIGIGLAGLLIVFHGGLGLTGGALALVAMVGLVAAPASAAFGRVVGRREAATLPRTLLLSWSMGLAGLTLLAVGLIAGPRRLALDARTLGAIAYLSIAGSVAVFVLLYWLLGKVRAVSVALADLALPVLTPLAGWAFYGEPLTSAVMVGAVLVVAGLGLAAADAARRAGRPRTARAVARPDLSGET
jgi:drug/metabolite transporter (DMT)-like permease